MSNGLLELVSFKFELPRLICYYQVRFVAALRNFAIRCDVSSNRNFLSGYNIDVTLSEERAFHVKFSLVQLLKEQFLLDLRVS